MALPPTEARKHNLNKSTRGKRLFKRVVGRRPTARKFTESRVRGRSLSGR